MQIALIATAHISTHGLHQRPGDRFETTPILAAVLTRQRKARFITADDTAPRRRTYRRRDLTAETDPT